MRLFLTLGILSLILFSFGCASNSVYYPSNISNLRIINDSYNLRYDDLANGKIALLPSLNYTTQNNINTILDSILKSTLPDLFPDMISMYNSNYDQTQSISNEDLTYDLRKINDLNFPERFYFFVEVDSIWKGRKYGEYRESGGRVYRETFVISVLDTRLSIYDKLTEQIVFKRRIQGIVQKNGYGNDTDFNSDFRFIGISQQIVNPICTSINILKLPSELQTKLTIYNYSKKIDNVDVDSIIEILSIFGAKVRKKKVDYVVEYENLKIYLPLNKRLFTRVNYFDIIRMIKKLNLYYEDIEKEVLTNYGKIHTY